MPSTSAHSKKKKRFFGLVNRASGKEGESRAGKDHAVMDVSRITDQIYVGTNACCQMHYATLLVRRGITHDLSLEGERVDAPYGVDSYLWLPTPDHTAPTNMSFRLGLNYIDTAIRNGGKVFIHCTNGHGRAPTMVAAWFVKEGMGVDDAISILREGRPEIHIEPAQRRALVWCKKTFQNA